MNIFYSTRNLDFETKIKILNEAKAMAYYWRVDELDCNVSFFRRKIEMSFEDIMKKFKNNSHFVIIVRPIDFVTEKPYLEIGFCLLQPHDYYLWLYLDLKHLPYFINTYDLKPNF